MRVVSSARFQKIETREAAAAVRRLSPRDRARASRVRAQARIAEQLPVLLGLLPRLPHQKAVDKSAQVEAVYVGIEDRVYLISDSGRRRRASETVLAHELTHALEQQNLGSEGPRLSSPFSDASDARFAVKEGSATLTQYRYARRYLHDREPIAEKLREPPLTGSRLDRYLQDGANFSYLRGARFVAALYRRGGALLVNRAVRHPPATTASILDPSRWPARDRPLPPEGVVRPGPGWDRSYSGSFGAATTHQLFFVTAPSSAAARLVRDWQGGTIEIWQHAAAVARHARPTRAGSVTLVRWRWRRPGDTVLATRAIDAYLSSAFHAQAARAGVWQWSGGGAALTSGGSTSTLAVAPSAATAVAAGANSPPVLWVR